MNNVSLSHSVSGSEIPEHSYTEKEIESGASQVVQKVLSKSDRVLECLREANGESLTVEEIVEETSLSKQDVTRVIRKALSGDAETREVFEDENEKGSYFLTEPMLDRLAV